MRLKNNYVKNQFYNKILLLLSSMNYKMPESIHNFNIKYGKPIFQLTWYSVRLFIICTLILHIILIFYGCGFLIVGRSVYNDVGIFINMVSSAYDGTVLTILLTIIALICIPLHIFGINLLFRSMKISKNPRTNHLMFSYVLILIIAILVFMGIGIGTLEHSYGLHEKLHDGITDAMAKYSNETDMKINIDKLQIEFQCCGSKTYEEWFFITWFDPVLAGKSLKPNEVFIDDSTPFSCCAMDTVRPCIHHDIMSDGLIYKYNPKTDINVNKKGCHSVIVEATDTIGWKIICNIFFLMLLEFCVLFGMRIIQTSYSNKMHFDESKVYTAWFFGCVKGSTSEIDRSIDNKEYLLPPIPEEYLDQ